MNYFLRQYKRQGGGRSTNRANRLLMDYFFPDLGLEAGVGAVWVVETLAAARQTFQELLAARVGHSFLK
jgi:hypothetical protein